MDQKWTSHPKNIKTMDEDQKKEQEELERLLNEPDENQDDSGEGDDTPDDDKGGGTPPAGTETEDKGSEDDNAGTAEDDKGKKTKDRWNGRSREDVIKDYESLEQKLATADDKGKAKEEKPAEDKKQVDTPAVPSAEELQKMTPTDFAKWVMTRIDEGVKKTVESQTKIRDSVRKEIAEAKKDHPLDDPDYRKMVMTIIDAASAKGTTIPLKEACKQVDAFIGKHKGQSEEISDEERSRLKKAKAQVESGAGAPTTPDGSDADTQRIQKALGGSGSKSTLGGLGI